MSSPTTDDNAAISPDAPTRNGGSKTNYLGLLIFLGLLAGGGHFGYRYWQHSRLYESTDDAQVEGDVVSLSSEVAARVKKLHVEDNQFVKKGDVLVELEDTDYAVKLEQAEKALKTLEKRQQTAQAQLELTRQSGQAGIIQGQSGVEVAQASVATAQTGVATSQQRLAQARAATAVARANLARSRTSVNVARSEVQRLDADAQRYRALYSQEEISRQQLDNAVIAARQAHDRLEASRREVQAAQAQVVQAQAGEAQAQEAIGQSLSQVEETRARVEEARSRLLVAQTAPEQVAVASAQVKVSWADLEQTRTNRKLAQKELERCRILAPCDGVVSKRSALEGTYVQKGSPLLALVATRQLWVVANFKETQMTQIRPGLEAEIDVDSYPGKRFKGHVESIQSGTGARFSLLPPENAAGSFVKVVQRLPVKITFDLPPSSETPLRPGMSVEAQVRLP